MPSRRSSKRRSSRRSAPTHTRSTSRTVIKQAGSSTAVWMGALALAGVAAVGAAVYVSNKKSSTPAPPPGVLPPPAPNPNPAPGPQPSSLPQTGDVYSALSAAQQTAVQASLYAYIVQGYGGCPTVFPNGMTDIQTTNGITSAASLADAGNRTLAVDCFQQANSISEPNGQGVLGITTYRKLMGV